MSHSHNIHDTDPHFVINPVTRTMDNNSGKSTLVQYDHNSERFTFEIPSMIDEHDMSMCDLVEIHYVNTSSASKSTNNAGVYIVDDLQLSPDNNTVTFSWLISGYATEHVGKLEFGIRFVCDDGDGNPEYVWNTTTYSGVSIISSIYNGEELEEEYPDVFAQLDARIKNLENGDVDVNIEVDTEMSDESENPVQNKVVKKYVDDKIDQTSPDNEHDIVLDVPVVADYVAGEDAYLYSSGLVNTRNLDWQERFRISQYGSYVQKEIFGKDKIIKVNRDAQPTYGNGNPRYDNRFFLTNTIDNSGTVDGSEINCEAYVWPKPTNPDTIKNILVVGDSYTARGDWLEYMKSQHMSALDNYRFIGQYEEFSELLDIDSTTVNGVTYDVADGLLTIETTGTRNGTFEVLLPLRKSLPAGDYKLKVESKTTGGNFISWSIAFTNPQGTSVTAKTTKIYSNTPANADLVNNYDFVKEKDDSQSFTITDGNIAEKIYISVPSNYEISREQFVIKILHDKGYEATNGYAWENYLCDKNETFTFNGTYNENNVGKILDGTTNPFWDDSTSSVNIRKYVDERGIKNANLDENDNYILDESDNYTVAHLDYVICLLGYNERATNAYWTGVYDKNLPAAIQAIKEYATEFIDKVHTTYPNCKILLAGYALPPFYDGINNSKWIELFDRADFVHSLNKAYQELAATYPEYVRFAHVTSGIDYTSAYKVGETTINGVTYKTVINEDKGQADDLHMNTTGQHQLAEVMWRGFVGLVNM